MIRSPEALGSKTFRNNLGKSLRKHEERLREIELRGESAMSLPSRLGSLAIIVSNRPFAQSEYTAIEQISAFHDEADRIAAERRAEHDDVKIIRSAMSHSMADVIKDPEVSDIVLIGHGSINTFWLDNGDIMGWYKASRHVEKLKQGGMVQRSCGDFRDFRSVPFGTFILADQRKLLAPLGMYIDDIDPDESVFMPVYDKPVNDFSDITSLINYYTSLSSEQLEEV